MTRETSPSAFSLKQSVAKAISGQRRIDFHGSPNRLALHYLRVVTSADACYNLPSGSAGFPEQTPKQLIEPLFAFLRLSADQFDGLGRRNDSNAFVLPAQAEQVLVAGDDQLGIDRQGTGEHLVIVGVIGHHAWHGGRLHHDGRVLIAFEQLVQCHAAEDDGAGKFRCVESRCQFRQQCRAGVKRYLAKRGGLQQTPGICPDTTAPTPPHWCQ